MFETLSHWNKDLADPLRFNYKNVRSVRMKILEKKEFNLPRILKK